MKQKLMIFVAVLLTAWCAPQAHAYDFSATAPSGQTVYYNIEYGQAIVTYQSYSSDANSNNYSALTGNLVLPDSVEYNNVMYPVKEIDENAFAGCTGLTGITVPATVNNIGYDAFKNCVNLSSVTIQSSNYSLGSGAFSGCTSLTSIVLPHGVSTIQSELFSGCTSLTSITIPSSVNSIYYKAFEGCTGLTQVIIPSSVFEIWDAAFAGCTSLTSINIPATVTFIGDGSTYGNVFGGCSNVISITVAAGNPNYDSRNNCNAIIDKANNTLIAACKNTVIPQSVIRIGNSAFAGLYTLTSISIPDSVVEIKSSAFSGCTGLTELHLPNSVTKIGESAFSGCTHLMLYVPSSVSSVRSSAFQNVRRVIFNHDNNTWGAKMFSKVAENGLFYADTEKTTLNGAVDNLTTINIPSTVTSVAANSFSDHHNLTSVTIPSTVASIGNYAFACPTLTTVNYNAASVTTSNNIFSYPHSDSAFYYDSEGNRVVVPYIDPVTGHINYEYYTGNQVEIHFDNNYVYGTRIWDTVWAPITTFNIGDSVRVIPSGILYMCPTLTSLTIPASVTGIGTAAFACPNLSALTYNATNAYISTYSGSSSIQTPFYVLPQEYYYQDSVFAPITNLTIGNNVESIPEYFMYGISTLQTVNLPTSLVTINQYAFSGTSLNTSITLPASLEYLGRYAFDGTSLTTLNYNARSAKIGYMSYSYNYSTDEYVDYWDTYSSYSDINSVFSNVATINIGNTVDSIPANLIYGDSTMTSLTIPANVKYVGNYAFLCRNLTTLNYNATYANMSFNAFSRTTSHYDYNTYHYVYDTIKAPIATLNIGNNVCRIPDNFMSHNNVLTSVTLPDSVRYIGSNAFSYTSITSITIPAAVDSIGDAAFADCPLAAVNYNATHAVNAGDGEGYVFTPSHHYDDNDNTIWDIDAQTLNIGSNVRTLTEAIFAGMRIASVTLPDSLQNISKYCFQGSALASIIIPDQVSSIGNYAFSGCNSLTSAIIGDGVTSIGQRAFRGCSTLRRVTIGESVSSIGTQAFYGSLTNPDTIFVRATVPPTITSNTFEGVPTNAKIRVPCGTIEDYQDASYWNNFTRISEDPSCYNLIIAQPNNAAYGSVTGGGSYSLGNIATLSAMPHNGYAFIGWADGSVDNPRLVLVTGNASYTANFASAATTVVHDTTYINVTVHDTSYVQVPVHDTTVVTLTDTVTVTEFVSVHDTTYVQVPVHDTTVVTLTDTVTVTVTEYVPVHDTLVVGDADTLIVYRDIHDTTYITLTDTVTNTVFDTVTNTVFDTIDNYIYDTLTLTDTILLTQYDTIWLYDTVYIHDTIYITEQGIDGVESVNAKIYQRDGQIVVESGNGMPLEDVRVFDAVGRAIRKSEFGVQNSEIRIEVPASGVYLVKIGNAPARRIVVIR